MATVVDGLVSPVNIQAVDQPTGFSGSELLNQALFGGKSSSVSSNDESSSKDDEITGSRTTLSSSPGDENDVSGAEPIAIVGMGMRLPGGVEKAEDFWRLLVDKKEGRCRVPEDRYNVDSFYSAHNKPGHVKTEYGHFLQNNLKHIDTSFFTMTRSETDKLDPQARLLLEVTREALENAGEVGWRGQNIACFVGVFGEDWQDIHQKDVQDAGMYRVTGYGDFLLGNRISYEYDLKGPSMTIKTGCSSSLICLHMACEAILKGECTSAVVAGTNLIMSPTMTVAMSEQGVLSSGARCKTFDKTADGYARGEAINVLYVKKLSDAIRDGNPIQAIVRATATNCDGKTPGISHPSSESHEALLRRAHEVAGLKDFSQTAFVECHGTGTSIGDPLEATAVANVFGKHGIYIGSHKPNVGHSEGASGITGVIKTVLSLQNSTIPPNINYSSPNPKIPFGEMLKVPTEVMEWPADKAERACVNSFGLGGANATVIIDSAASFGFSSRPAKASPPESANSRLLVFSANHTESLNRQTKLYQEYLTENPSSLDSLAYTLGARREHLPYRTFRVTNGVKSIEGTACVRPANAPQINFVFTGQGAQWLGMAKELIAEYPSFKEDIHFMDNVLSSLPEPSTWSIYDELLGIGNPHVNDPKNDTRFKKAEYSQPLCTAIQVAMVNLLQNWGITPAAVVGHSSGEICAAYATKSITMKEAIKIAYYRGQVTKLQRRAGGMAAVGLGKDEVTSYLVPGVVVACENSPASSTLSGDLDSLEVVLGKLKAERPEVFARALQVEMAYHSHHMEEIGEEYEALLLDSVKPEDPKVPFFSSVSGLLIENGAQLGPKYWRKNLESPVLFSTACKALLAAKGNDHLFLELGPHAALQGPLRQIFQEAAGSQAPTYVSALQRSTDAAQSFLAAVAQMFLKSVPVDFEAMCPGSVLTDLPHYPWFHDVEYWDESRVSREWRLRKFKHHDILGIRITETSDLEPAWRNMLRLDDVPWARDHQIASDTIFPGAGYIAMAGEAVRQITGTPDYTVRQVTLSSAMVLSETHATELLTTLRPLRLTTSLDSAWYEFTVTSHNGTSWTKHCVGQVRAGPEHELVAPIIPTLPREVEAPRWYQALRRVGLNYGPRFQGMTNISAATDSNKAVASMTNYIEEAESEFQLHPSTIDLCIQLFAAAGARGLPRNLNQLSVPVFFEKMYVARPDSEMRVCAEVSSTPRGSMVGDAVAVSNGKVVLDVKGLKLFPLDDDNDDRGSDPHAAASIHWGADINFLQVKDLVGPSEGNQREYYWDVEKLAILCSIESDHLLSSVTPSEKHLEKYKSWLAMITSRATKGDLQLVSDAQQFTYMASEERQTLIKSLHQKILSTPTKAAAIAISRIFESLKGIFEGEIDALQVLLKDDILTQLYNMGDRWDYQKFFKALTHSKPWLRVLEIGAGTGGTTASILPLLISPQGERMYSTYHYTDISGGFFGQAKERFAEYEKMEYSVLDISQNPVDQGFIEGSYDLIIATNVLHATPQLNATLKNVHKLLKPDGHIFLDELCSEAKWLNYIMGNLSGWWLGEEDNRPLEPYVSPERWTEELLASGFTTPAVVYDDEIPYQANALIISSPAPITTSVNKNVTLLCNSHSDVLVSSVLAELMVQGYAVDFCTLEETPKAGQDIISLLDLSSPFLENITEERYTSLLKFLSHLATSGMTWVTRTSQVNCTDPRFAQCLGLMRAVRNELAIDVATLELDVCGDEASEHIVKVFQRFQLRDKTGDYEPDFEYVLDSGLIQIPRFHWFSVSNEMSKGIENEAQGPKRLEIGKRGFLKTLGWVQRPAVELASDQVEVNVKACGMNFKDVLIAMGIVDGHVSEGNGLGCECSGVVVKVGNEVKNVSVGDRVVVFTGGSYATSLVTTYKLVSKMPDSLSFEDGATMPCVYSTVIRSLIHLARLEKNQTVLIQSACGGIGISAIQIAKMIGATIYATVGTEEKVKYLIDTFGIPRENIFNSRNTSFLPDVLRATNGRGVDVVLNSLSGELLHASWQCVAKHGSMVEIGKRDFIGRGKLAMDVFESNRSFFGVDFAEICVERQDITQRVLEECMKYFADGLIGPVGPITHFPASKIEDAFRFMQKGSHIGKIVVTMPEDPSELQVTDLARSFALRSDATYVLVGGLGGLGKAISTWMVDNGARSLLYLSRSAGKSVEDQKFFAALESQGCTATAFPGSINNLSDVEQALALAPSPVAGVLQMSMVLRDGPLPEMSHQDWNTAVEPKVNGTWNIHRATASMNLDFLVLFSSSSGLVGQRGQANYASANTFLDAFVQYRHANGLAASVLDIGPVEEIGYLSTNKMVLEQFRATAVHCLQEQDVLDSLQLIIQRSEPQSHPSKDYVNNSQVGIGLRMTMPWGAGNNRCIWKRDVRMSVYRNIEQVDASDEKSTDPGLRQFLAAVEGNPASLREMSSVEFLAKEMGSTLYGFLLIPLDQLDLDASIAALGVDSLVAIELRNWCRHKLGVEMTVLEILGFENLISFGEVAAQRLYSKYGGDEEHVRESFLQMKAP